MLVSLKATHEIMEAVREKRIDPAVAFLGRVLKKEAFVPFKRYPSKGHKGGVPAGYPVKATKAVISLLKELKANAKAYGLDADKVVISEYALGKSGYPRYHGGKVSRRGKHTNLTVFGVSEKIEKPAEIPVAKTETKEESQEVAATAIEAAGETGAEEKPAEETNENVTKEANRQ